MHQGHTSAVLATSDRFLLLSGAGFGKSAALRVIIHSLLSDSARFPALAKSWGQRLPLLLPFGFLTRHFAEHETPTVEGALNAWLKVLGARDDVLILLEELLADERLLLLVDGIVINAPRANASNPSFTTISSNAIRSTSISSGSKTNPSKTPPICRHPTSLPLKSSRISKPA